MHIHTSEAIILRRIDYGEADRIVTFLTPLQGRIKGFARSARKSRKRFGASLEPCALVRISWTESRSSEMLTLKEAELLDLHVGLRGNLDSLALAGYGCELVDTLLGEEGHPEAFALLRSFLGYLNVGGTSTEARLLLELRVLLLGGYSPHLLHCSDCGASLPEGEARFDAGRGGSLCLSCCGRNQGMPIGTPTLGTLARCLRGEITRFADVRFSERTVREASPVLSACLNLHLQRPLRTLLFLERTVKPG